jgi:anti-sigma factor RsiW
VTCEFLNLTVASIDGELDAQSAQLAARHVATCPTCQAELAAIRDGRQALREAWGREVASTALRQRITSALDGVETEIKSARPARHRPWMAASFRWGALAGLACSVVVTAMVLGTQYLRAGVGVDMIVDEHVTAARIGELTEVISSDHHTVKPWFAARADVSPVVADHRAEGFVLAGGRVADLHGQRVAVMVYRHGQHVIDVYAYRAQGPRPRRETERFGYHVACWSRSDVTYCAVGDTQWSDMRRFQALVQGSE